MVGAFFLFSPIVDCFSSSASSDELPKTSFRLIFIILADAELDPLGSLNIVSQSARFQKVVHPRSHPLPPPQFGKRLYFFPIRNVAVAAAEAGASLAIACQRKVRDTAVAAARALFSCLLQWIVLNVFRSCYLNKSFCKF